MHKNLSISLVFLIRNRLCYFMHGKQKLRFKREKNRETSSYIPAYIENLDNIPKFLSFLKSWRGFHHNTIRGSLDRNSWLLVGLTCTVGHVWWCSEGRDQRGSILSGLATAKMLLPIMSYMKVTNRFDDDSDEHKGANILRTSTAFTGAQIFSNLKQFGPYLTPNHSDHLAMMARWFPLWFWIVFTIRLWLLWSTFNSRPAYLQLHKPENFPAWRESLSPLASPKQLRHNSDVDYARSSIHLGELYQTAVWFRRVGANLVPDAMGSCHALCALYTKGPSLYQTSSSRWPKRLHQDPPE